MSKDQNTRKDSKYLFTDLVYEEQRYGHNLILSNLLLRVLARYDAKIVPPLHVSLNSSVARPSFKNLSDNFLTKWPGMSKVCLHFQGDL